MPKATACPDVSQYQWLASNDLAEAEQEALLAHLEGCESCAQKLAALPEPDPLVELVRQSADHSGDSEIVSGLVRRLRQLGPVPTHSDEGVQTPPQRETAVARTVAVTESRDPSRTMSLLEAAALQQRGGLVPAERPDRELTEFLMPPQSSDELGRLGPYRILKILGHGGMGVVYKAEDPQLKRLVALKAMLPGLGATARQRFLREAQLAAAIKHDHMVTIHQVGEDRGAPFLAMEFLEGEPLDARLKREGKLPLPEVLRIGREVALGLAAAHKRGLIHRDIKPANLWLETPGEPGASATGGRVKILDFGLARETSDAAHLTQSGAIIGTPAYMAPEQARGEPLDARCDLFSLGCVLYRLCMGEPPFKGNDTISTLMAVATAHPRPPCAVSREVPPALSDLVMRLLAKKPEERPQTAALVAEQLQQIATTLPPPKPHKPVGVRAGRRRRTPWLIAAAMLLLSLGAYFLAPVVFRVATPQGTPAVQTDGQKADNVRLSVKQGGRQIERLDLKTNKQNAPGPWQPIPLDAKLSEWWLEENKEPEPVAVVNVEGEPALRLRPGYGKDPVAVLAKRLRPKNHHLRLEFQFRRNGNLVAGYSLDEKTEPGRSNSGVRFNLNKSNNKQAIVELLSATANEGQLKDGAIVFKRPLKREALFGPPGGQWKWLDTILKPAGQWNRLDLLWADDRMALFINGRLLGALTEVRGLSAIDGKAIDPARTALTLQCQFGEVLIRRIEFRDIGAFQPELSELSLIPPSPQPGSKQVPP